VADVLTVEQLVGEELGTVSFVADYVEFNFNGPIVRAISRPIVRITDETARFPDAGSRDALCSLIFGIVVSVTDSPESLLIDFGTRGRLTIPKADPLAGPEVIHFIPMRGGKRDVGSMHIVENLIPTR
jgi:hypothetical protein